MSTQSDPLLHDPRPNQAPQEEVLSPEYEQAILAARKADMPIIDISQESMNRYRRRWPRRAERYFVWFHYLRPVVLVVCWALVVWYVWAQVSGAPLGGTGLGLFDLYLLVMLTVALMLMLSVAWKWLERRNEDDRLGAPRGPSTLEEVSHYAGISTDELERWQAERVVMAHHDALGQFVATSTSARPPAAVPPLTTDPATSDDIQQPPCMR